MIGFVINMFMVLLWVNLGVASDDFAAYVPAICLNAFFGLLCLMLDHLD